MKKLLSLLLILLMCFSFTACKEKDTTSVNSEVSVTTKDLEHEIRVLMEKNLDCYYMFYIAPLNHTQQQNSDGYYGTDGSFLSTYPELENLVNSTYVADTAKKLLSHPSESTPLYKNVDDKIFVLPEAITPAEYNIFWDDSYTVEFIEKSDTECSFTLTTTDINGNEYKRNGSALFEDEKWLFEDLIY